MAEATKTITFRGSPMGLHQLVQALRHEGVQVQYEPPQERRDLASMAEAYVVELLVAGTLAGIKVGLDRFRKHGGRGTAELQDGDRDKDD